MGTTRRIRGSAGNQLVPGLPDLKVRALKEAGLTPEIKHDNTYNARIPYRLSATTRARGLPPFSLM